MGKQHRLPACGDRPSRWRRKCPTWPTCGDGSFSPWPWHGEFIALLAGWGPHFLIFLGALHWKTMTSLCVFFFLELEAVFGTRHISNSFLTASNKNSASSVVKSVESHCRGTTCSLDSWRPVVVVCAAGRPPHSIKQQAEAESILLKTLEVCYCHIYRKLI